jgi:hypothetical protein
LGGAYLVTMEHPSVRRPAPLVIEIEAAGGTVKRARVPSTVTLVSRPAPRAG